MFCLVTYILTQLISYEFILCCTCYDKLSIKKRSSQNLGGSTTSFTAKSTLQLCPFIIQLYTRKGEITMAEVNTRKRGSKWEYRFEIASVGGKRKQKSKGGFRTKKEALEAGAKALNEYNNTGRSFTASDISVADYMDLWFNEHCKMNYKYNTQLNYKGQIEHHIKPCLGEYKLSSLTPATIQIFVNNLKIKGYSKSHTVGIFTTLSSALDYAIEPLKLIQFNPASPVKIPRFEPRKSIRYIISVKDFERILELFPLGHPFHIPTILGYMAGLRKSEVYGVSWDDIDFENKTLRINKSVYKRYADMTRQTKGFGWFIGTPKTHKSNRVIKLDDWTLSTLKKEKTRQKENKLFYGKYYTVLYKRVEIDETGSEIQKIIESDQPLNLSKLNLICVKENGEYCDSDTEKYYSKVIRNKVGINFNFHSLRHTHATLLMENGANPIDVAERLGHTNIEQTFAYSHNTVKMQEQSVDILSSVVKI